jgi:hypothetical protein
MDYEGEFDEIGLEFTREIREDFLKQIPFSEYHAIEKVDGQDQSADDVCDFGSYEKIFHCQIDNDLFGEWILLAKHMKGYYVYFRAQTESSGFGSGSDFCKIWYGYDPKNFLNFALFEGDIRRIRESDRFYIDMRG